MRRVLLALFWLFAACYLLALAVLVIGTQGLFGQPKDALAGVFVIVLGWPWMLAAGEAPESLRPWLAAASPLLNLAILGGLARLAGRGRRRAPQP